MGIVHLTERRQRDVVLFPCVVFSTMSPAVGLWQTLLSQPGCAAMLAAMARARSRSEFQKRTWDDGTGMGTALRANIRGELGGKTIV